MNNSEEVIYGRNAVTEAIKSGMAINKILIASGEISGSLKAIIGLAKANHIVYQFVDRNKLNELSGGKNHQGVLLFAAAGKYCEIDDLLAKAKEAGEPPFLLLLDEIQDPHNFGGYYPYGGCRRSTRNYYPEEALGSAYGNGSQNLRRCFRARSHSQSLKSCRSDRYSERSWPLDCRYGFKRKHSVLRSRFQRTDRNRDRQRGKRDGTADRQKMRFHRYDSDARRRLLSECFGCRRRSTV